MLPVLTRRFPMKRTVFVAAFALLVAFSAPAQPTNHNEETVAQFQAEMAAGKLTSVQLTQYYIDRIMALDQNEVNSVIKRGSFRRSPATARRRTPTAHI